MPESAHSWYTKHAPKSTDSSQVAEISSCLISSTFFLFYRPQGGVWQTKDINCHTPSIEYAFALFS